MPLRTLIYTVTKHHNLQQSSDYGKFSKVSVPRVRKLHTTLIGNNTGEKLMEYNLKIWMPTMQRNQEDQQSFFLKK